MEYRPGWPDAWLPDGSNWGRVLSFKMMAWNPLTVEQKEKYGNLVDHTWPPVTILAQLAQSHHSLLHVNTTCTCIVIRDREFVIRDSTGAT